MFLKVSKCLVKAVYRLSNVEPPLQYATEGRHYASPASYLFPSLSFSSKLWSRSFGTNPWLESDLIFNLGDNPDGGWVTWSAPGPSDSMHRVPTFRRKWTAQWLPSKNRWLTTSERCVCMGFPASTELAVCLGLVGQYQLSWHQRHTVGNAMHLANVGVWQACVAASAILLGCSS